MTRQLRRIVSADGEVLSELDVLSDDELAADRHIDQGPRWRMRVPGREVADELGYEGSVWNPAASA